MRDAAEGGQRQETEVDHAQDQAQTLAQRVVGQFGKQVLEKKKREGRRSTAGPDAPTPPSGAPSDVQPPDIPQDCTSLVRIKTREAVHDPASVKRGPARTPRHNTSQIRTKESVRHSASATQGHTDAFVSDTSQIKTRETAHAPLPTKQHSTASVRTETPQIKTKDSYVRGHRQLNGAKHEQPGASFSAPASTERQPPQPMEQGRNKFIQEQQKKAALQRTERHRVSDATLTTGQQNSGGSVRSQLISTPSTRPKNQQPVGKAVRGTASDSKCKIRETRSGQKAVGRVSRQPVKSARLSKQVVQSGTHQAKTAQQMAQAASKAQQRTVQAAGAAKRTAAVVDKPVAKAAASALRGAVSAIRGLMAPLAAGGGAVIAVVLVLCLVGALLMSPLEIFFSGEDIGTGQTMTSAVREINQEYNDRVESLKTGASYDELSVSGTRATWPEILAVYAVKTVTDPTNGQDVITMDDEKKELLKQVFWDMNELSSFTSTVPGEEDEKDTTTLYIVTLHKTMDEMANLYGFDADQRQQLAELLSDDYQDLWNAVLYGIGTGSGEIVAVALSQVGNIGGQPYWSWYGFTYRVDWCAIFVSWCANECGYIDAGVIPKFAGCVQGSRWFKERGLWQDKAYVPNPGDVVFFDWDNPGGFSGPQDGVPDHVGIVERVENGRVYTVEGNSGDKCCQRSYPLGYYEIYGYGCYALDSILYQRSRL